MTCGCWFRNCCICCSLCSYVHAHLYIHNSHILYDYSDYPVSYLVCVATGISLWFECSNIQVNINHTRWLEILPLGNLQVETLPLSTLTRQTSSKTMCMWIIASSSMEEIKLVVEYLCTFMSIQYPSILAALERYILKLSLSQTASLLVTMLQ